LGLRDQREEGGAHTKPLPKERRRRRRRRRRRERERKRKREKGHNQEMTEEGLAEREGGRQFLSLHASLLALCSSSAAEEKFFGSPFPASSNSSLKSISLRMHAWSYLSCTDPSGKSRIVS